MYGMMIGLLIFINALSGLLNAILTDCVHHIYIGSSSSCLDHTIVRHQQH